MADLAKLLGMGVKSIQLVRLASAGGDVIISPVDLSKSCIINIGQTNPTTARFLNNQTITGTNASSTALRNVCVIDFGHLVKKVQHGVVDSWGEGVTVPIATVNPENCALIITGTTRRILIEANRLSVTNEGPGSSSVGFWQLIEFWGKQ